MRSRTGSFCLFVFLAYAGLRPLAADTVFVGSQDPTCPSFAVVCDTAMPFGDDSVLSYQQIYSGSSLASFGGATTITGLAFTVDAFEGLTPPDFSSGPYDLPSTFDITLAPVATGTPLGVTLAPTLADDQANSLMPDPTFQPDATLQLVAYDPTICQPNANTTAATPGPLPVACLVVTLSSSNYLTDYNPLTDGDLLVDVEQLSPGPSYLFDLAADDTTLGSAEVSIAGYGCEDGCFFDGSSGLPQFGLVTGLIGTPYMPPPPPTVPEPPTLGLTAAGLVAFAIVGSRRRVARIRE